MILIPSQCLVLSLGLFLLILTSVLGFFIHNPWLIAFLSLFSLLPFLVDALISLKQAQYLSYSASSHLKIKVGNLIEFKINCYQGKPLSHPLRLKLSLSESVGLEYINWSIPVTLDPKISTTVIDYLVQANTRGRYSIEKIHIQYESRFGFWWWRTTVPLSSQIEVQPNLTLDYYQLAPFLNSHQFGNHTLRQRGQGKEFEKLRDYQMGDSYTNIAWKASSRRSKWVTIERQIEKTQEIYAVIDSSRYSKKVIQYQHGNEKKYHAVTLFERNIQAALLLFRAALKQGDKFGLIVYDDQIRIHLKANSGQLHFNSCMKQLLCTNPSHHSPNYPVVLSSISQLIPQRTYFSFLASLDDEWNSEGFIKGCQLLSHKHLIGVISIDSIDIKPIFDRHSKPSSIDQMYRALNGHLLYLNQHRTEIELKNLGITYHFASAENYVKQVVLQYLNIKKQQKL